MPTHLRPGAYRSQLIPHQEEISILRRTNPPTPYRTIAQILNAKYQLTVTYNGVWQFVKARSKGRKVYAMSLTE
jgi:hypothetical protein